MTSRVRPGLEVFLESAGRPWRGKRLGLLAHGASVTPGLVHALDALRGARHRIVSLFAPEHGWGGTLQDQALVRSAREPASGLPIHSLYGPRRAPEPGALAGLDALVVDLQDVGVRYYTFLWTMALALEACGKAGAPMVVLDRPNPLGGERLEGNRLEPAFKSFVGLHPVPVVHGLTAGEMALWVNARLERPAELTVVPMNGWRRRFLFEETGLPWVLPSPNMPTPDTARVYAGTCLLEATNLSEGRGTTRPFEIVGAPYVDGERLADTLAAQRLPGVRFRPLVFRPTSNKWAGRDCGGLQIHPTDAARFRPYLTGLCLVQAARRLWPRHFRWADPPYEFERVKRPMDILCGSAGPREAIERGEDLPALARSWAPELARFRAERRPFLLYH